MVQWLRLHASCAGALGLVPGWELRFRPQGAAKKKNLLFEKLGIFGDTMFECLRAVGL